MRGIWINGRRGMATSPVASTARPHGAFKQTADVEKGELSRWDRVGILSRQQRFLAHISVARESLDCIPMTTVWGESCDDWGRCILVGGGSFELLLKLWLNSQANVPHKVLITTPMAVQVGATRVGASAIK